MKKNENIKNLELSDILEEYIKSINDDVRQCMRESSEDWHNCISTEFQEIILKACKIA